DAANPDPAICGLITRDAANAQVVMTTTGYVNASTMSYEGFTYSIDQRLPLTDAPLFRSLSDPGEIELGLNVNQLRRLETSISGLGYDRNVAKGEINSPEWKAQFSLRYRNDAFSFAWFTNYVSSAEFDVTFTEEDRDIRKV